MADFVNGILRDMGPAGAAIYVLLTAISGLATANIFQYRQGNKVYGYRLAERDILNKALTESTIAINAFAAVSKERNDLTEELADVVNKLLIGLEHQKSLNEEMRRDVQKQTEVFASLSEAVRVNTGMATDTRNWIQNLPRRR